MLGKTAENDYQKLLTIIGKNVAKYRKIKGLTQIKLAKALNIASNTINNIEKASASSSLQMIFCISQALDVSVCKLFEADEIIISNNEVVRAVINEAIKTIDAERLLQDA